MQGIYLLYVFNILRSQGGRDLGNILNAFGLLTLFFHYFILNYKEVCSNDPIHNKSL